MASHPLSPSLPSTPNRPRQSVPIVPAAEGSCLDLPWAIPSAPQWERTFPGCPKTDPPYPPGPEHPRLSALVARRYADNEWILGTACLSHFTGDRGKFSSYVGLPEKKKIQLTTGGHVFAVGYGRVVLLLSQGKRLSFSAYHVPGCAFNMISPQMLEVAVTITQDGWHMVGDNFRAEGNRIYKLWVVKADAEGESRGAGVAGPSMDGDSRV